MCVDQRRGLRQRLFARYYASMNRRDDDEALAAIKRRCFGQVQGRVVEIGAGTGGSFPYLRSDVEWIGIEPNMYMHPHLRERALRHGFAPDIRPTVGERLPVEDASVDAVITSHVLCSVTDQSQVLREVLRVLRPGGRFAFVEHVAAPADSRLRFWQGVINPPWRFIGDGCNLNRETWAAIEMAGFSQVEIEHLSLPYFVAAPHIAGQAVK
jgi:ubiquinone/menaquinone biosynthesis C-methylase UbiE